MCLADIMLFLVFLCVVLLVIRQYQNFIRKRGMPPGPRGWPLIGNALALAKNFAVHKTLSSWARVHGDVYSLNLFGDDIVVVSGEDTIKEVLVQKSTDFSGRPPMFRIHYLFDMKDDMIFSGGSSKWALKKKLALTSLKMYSEGRLDDLTNLCAEVAERLMQNMIKHDGVGFDPLEGMQASVTSVITYLIYGRHMNEPDLADLRQVETMADDLFRMGGSGIELDLFPMLSKLPNKTFSKLDRAKEFQKRCFSRLLDINRANFDDQNTQCVADELLKYQRRTAKHGNMAINLDDIDLIIRNLMAAGMVTTSRAMYALLAIFLVHPKIQKKIQKETDEVIGLRRPCPNDKHNMPYTEACLLELLRYISHIPLGLVHKALVDSSIGGYKIPKGTQVWTNLWHLQHRWDYWTTPWRFMPERFLDKNGQVVPPDHVNRKRLMPFGAGRRVCVGEVLAKNCLFLFTVNLAQNMVFKRDPQAPADAQPVTDPRKFHPDMILKVPSFRLRAFPRTNPNGG